MDFSSFTTKLASVVMYATWQETIYGYMYTWSSVRRATRLKTTASCCMCAQTIIMCGGKAVCARTGCTQYIRNSTSEYFCLRERPFSTGRRGQIRVMSVYAMYDRSLRWCQDCKNIFCGSWDMIFWNIQLSVSTGRRGHIGVMSVHEMSHSERSLRWCKDCENIFCGSWNIKLLFSVIRYLMTSLWRHKFTWNYISWSNYVLSFKGLWTLKLCIMLWISLREKKRRRRRRRKKNPNNIKEVFAL